MNDILLDCFIKFLNKQLSHMSSTKIFYQFIDENDLNVQDIKYLLTIIDKLEVRIKDE